MTLTRYSQVLRPGLLVALALVVTVPGSTQTAQSNPTAANNSSLNASLGELQSQVRELKEFVPSNYNSRRRPAVRRSPICDRSWKPNAVQATP